MWMRKSILMATALLLGLAAPAFAASGFTLKAKPKIAMIIFDGIHDGGWSQEFNDSRMRMEKALHTKIPYVENVPEDAAQITPPVEKFIERGYNIIIGSAFGYSDTFKVLATKYPDVAFLNGAGTTNGPNLQSFYGRSYQSQYLCGMVAGAMSKTGNLGFVAANPFGLVNWAINGYELGAEVMNPKAKLHVIFTGAWNDPVKERAATEALIDQGADVIGQHVDTPTPQIVAQERGVYSTGHHRDMSSYAPKATVCSSVWVWSRYLIPEIKKIEAGNWKPNPYGDFPGLAQGGDDIVMTKLVPAKVRARVMKARAEMISGALRVYRGPIYDNTGKLRVPAGKVISDADLWKMNWYVPGVITQK
jgi:basic membrane protein A and related proteins